MPSVKIKESEKISKYQDIAGELKQKWNMKVGSHHKCYLCIWNNPERLWEVTEVMGNKGKNQDHPK